MGAVWTANITYVNGRIVGLRGWTTLGREFPERAAIALLVGTTERLVGVHAQVLSASGTLMRIVRRDDSIGNERRRTPRLRMAMTAGLSIGNGPQMQARLIDLSNTGCALMAPHALAVGNEAVIFLFLADAEITMQGTVVRTWLDDERATLAGIQFTSIDRITERRINQLLVEQLSTSSDTIAVP